MHLHLRVLQQSNLTKTLHAANEGLCSAQLLALTLIAASLGVGIEPAPARGHTPDTIVLVTGQGRFTLLSELSPEAKTLVLLLRQSG